MFDLYLKQSTAYVSMPLSSRERCQLTTTYVASTTSVVASSGACGSAKKEIITDSYADNICIYKTVRRTWKGKGVCTKG